MGFFSNLFGKKKSGPVVAFAPSDHPEMMDAYEEARKTFKYFWRELSWEYRRTVPVHGFSCVKLAFKQDKGGETVVEYMWIGQIVFNGDKVKGILVNEPGELTNVELGDVFEVNIDEICDWMFSINGKTYGGFSVQVIRSKMTEETRAKHDEAWGLDFDDPDDIAIVYEQKEHPENLIEHPMSIAMKDDVLAHVQQNPTEVTSKDGEGYTLLHRETIAGNKALVEILINAGAAIEAKTPTGKTAADYAKELNWEHILPLF